MKFGEKEDELFVLTNNDVINKWNITVYEKTEIKNIGIKSRCMDYSAANQWMAVGTKNGTVILFKVKTPDEQFTLDVGTKTDILQLTFNNKGTELICGDKEGNIYLWNTETKELKNKILAHTARIREIQYSPDETILATASYDGTIKLWATKDYNLLPIILRDHGTFINAIVFNLDGKYITTGDMSGTLIHWPVVTKLLSERICEKITRNLTQEEWNTYIAPDIEYEKTCNINE
ncbi:WD40 repeat domain-containing protein, partial [Bacteroidota bacterium]